MDELNKRIIEVMTMLGLNKSTFAKDLDVSLPLITHITSGRNKPGLDIIQKIILRFEKINPDWLITGKGETYRTLPEKTEYTAIYSSLTKIQTELTEQEKVVSTIKSYHKILIDEIKHLEEMREILDASTLKLKGIYPQIENIKTQLESK